MVLLFLTMIFISSNSCCLDGFFHIFHEITCEVDDIDLLISPLFFIFGVQQLTQCSISQVKVNGTNAAPVYKFLKASKGGICGSSIKWNFTKFLVDKEGRVLQRYSTTTSPLAIEVWIYIFVIIFSPPFFFLRRR